MEVFVPYVEGGKGGSLHGKIKVDPKLEEQLFPRYWLRNVRNSLLLEQGYVECSTPP